MARVPYLAASDLAPEHRHLVEGDMNLRRALAHTVEGSYALGNMVKFLRTQSKLDKRLCELAILQVAWLTKSSYEWVQHLELGLKVGLSEEDIRAIGLETAGRATPLDPLAKTVLRAAREMTKDVRMSDETFQALAASLGHEQVTELVIAIAFYNGMARALETLAIDVEPRLRPLLEKFPLP